MILWLLALAFDSSFAARAAEGVVSVKWSQLPVALSGQTARVVLQDVTVEGHPISVSPEAMEMFIEKTSDKTRYAKGQTTISRADVKTIYGVRTRIRGRVVGTLLGLWGASYATAAVQEDAMQVLIPVMGVIGYYVGKRTDITKIRIEILPD